jgi:hypothetical protein
MRAGSSSRSTNASPRSTSTPPEMPRRAPIT